VDSKIRTIKATWKAVFGKEPEVKIEGDESLALSVDAFTLTQMEGEVESKTILGTTRQKVMGWGSDVFVSTYSYQDGYDGDVVDLGWDARFEDALLRIIEANAHEIAENTIHAEGLAELYQEST